MSAEPLPSLSDIASKIMSPTPAVEEAPATETVAEESAAPEAPVAESISTEPKENVQEAPKEDKFGARFAALSRRERTIRQREKEAEQRMSDMEARLSDLKAKDEQWSNIKKNPLQALKSAGLSYADLTAEVLGQREEAPIDPVEERFKAMEARLAKADAVEAELNRIKVQSADEKVQAGERALRDNFVNTITESGDKYQLCGSMGPEALDLAREIVGQYFEKHNEVLTYSEVLDMVESHYEEQVLKKLLSTKKAKELAGASYKPATSETPKQAPAKPAKSASTLTNAAKARIDNVNVDELPKHQALDYLVKKYINA